MRLAIVGSRDNPTNQDWVWLVADAVNRSGFKPAHIISGGARGADRAAKAYGDSLGIPVTEHLPDWDRLGKAAGFIRNKTIVDDSDAVIALWDGSSKGTKSTIKLARDAGKQVYIYRLT